MKEIGLSGNEIKELIKKIDDDDKFEIILEKIGLIKSMIATETVKNPVSYTIKSIKNINYNKTNMIGKIKAEKRAEKDKKRKAERLARLKEKEKYERDLAKCVKKSKFIRIFKLISP